MCAKRIRQIDEWDVCLNSVTREICDHYWVEFVPLFGNVRQTEMMTDGCVNNDRLTATQRQTPR